MNATKITADLASRARAIADMLRDEAPRTRRYDARETFAASPEWNALEEDARWAEDYAATARKLAARKNASRAAKENAQAATDAAHEAWAALAA